LTTVNSPVFTGQLWIASLHTVAVGLSGQTLLRVQRNGLKIADYFYLSMKKIDGLLTIVWVSISM